MNSVVRPGNAKIASIIASRDNHYLPTMRDKNDAQRPVFQIHVTPVPLAVETSAATCFLLPPSSSSWGGGGGLHREYRIEITSCQALFDDDDKPEEGSSQTDENLLPICNVQMRFSEFYRRFACNDNDYYCFRQLRDSWRSFPIKYACWEDYTTNIENVQRRSKHMQHYLDQIWNHSSRFPFVWASTSMQIALDISEETQVYLRKLAEAEQERHMQLAQTRNEDIAREQRRFSAEKSKRWDAAQSLKLGMAGDAQTDPLPTLVYPTAMAFQVDVPFLSSRSGNLCIRENGKLWFELRRTDYPQLFPGSNLTNHLMTVRGRRSILVIREVFRMMDYKCEMFYMNSDGTYCPNSKVIIHRQFQFGAPQEIYSIKSFSRPHQNIKCSGSSGHIRIFVNGYCAATLGSELLSTSYTLKIGAGYDSLLVMGIVCAVARIRAHIRQQQNHTPIVGVV